MNMLAMRQVLLINFAAFILLLFLEAYRPNWGYAWLDLRIILFLLLGNFVFYLIFTNKKIKKLWKVTVFLSDCAGNHSSA